MRCAHSVDMATQTLIVTCARKDSTGNIVGVGGSGWFHASSEAINYIRSGTYQYRVLSLNGPYVRPYGTQYLRSDRDPHTGNNLDNLPSC